MSTKKQTPRNYRNLGYKVTTRNMSWEQMCRDAEGSRWNLPTGAYFFGENQQIVYVTYDFAITGPENQ